MGNHVVYSGLDAVLLVDHLLREKGIFLRPLGDHLHFKVPVWGEVLTRFGVVDGTRENAAFVGDLADAPDVPSDTFDCIVLTQTLQFVWDVKGALATCHRILAPGGTLLLTAPGLSQLDRGEWSESWYWAFTDRSMRRLLAEAFPGGDVAVTSYGNVYAATTFLWGMGAPEVRAELLEARDPCYPVIVAAAARKRS